MIGRERESFDRGGWINKKIADEPIWVQDWHMQNIKRTESWQTFAIGGILAISLVIASGNGLAQTQAIQTDGQTCIPVSVPSSGKTGSHMKMKEIRRIKLGDYITALAISPDSRLLATSEDFDRVIKIWDAETGKLIQTVNKTNKGSEQLFFTNDSASLITSSVAGYDGKNRTVVSVIDAHTGVVTRNVEGPHDPTSFPRANAPWTFALSPDGKHLYATFNVRDYMVHAYEVATWRDVGSFSMSAVAMVGGPKADEVTLVDGDGDARIWSASRHDFVKNFSAMKVSPGSMAFNPQTCRLAAGDALLLGTRETLHLWDLTTMTNINVEGLTPSIDGMDFSPDGAILAATSGKSVLLQDGGNLSSRIELHRFNEYAWRVSFSRDGRFLAIGGDREVIIFALD